MAIAICSFCGGLVLVHNTMCPHCGQRGETTVNRRKVSTFGSKQKLPVAVRRLIIVAAAGFGAVLCLAFANWIRPVSSESEVDVATECESIRQSGEEEPGQLQRCESRLVQMRAQQR